MQFQYETEIQFHNELCSAIITIDNVEYEHVPGEPWTGSTLGLECAKCEYEALLDMV